MEAKLKGGTTLIVDRYSYSGVAFSSAKGLDIEWCKVKDLARFFFFYWPQKKYGYNVRISTTSSFLVQFRVYILVFSLY